MLGWTALVWAVRFRSWESAYALLSYGADPNIKDNHGYSSLDYALDKKDTLMISLLLQFATHTNAIQRTKLESILKTLES